MRSFAFTAIIALAAAQVDPGNLLESDQHYAGLTAKYFTGSWDSLPYFSSLEPTYEDVVYELNYPVQEGVSFGTSGYAQFVGATFEGWVKVPESGEWQFSTESDDGSDLWIGDNADPVNWQMVVNNNEMHGMRKREGTITLDAGWYPIWLSYFQKEGKHALMVGYQGPNTPFQMIPASNFMHGGNSPPALDADYRKVDDVSGCVKPDYSQVLTSVVQNMQWSELWSALNDDVNQKVLADEYTEAFTNAWYQYQRCMYELPKVCEDGIDCRMQIRIEMDAVLKADWLAYFESIRELVDDSFVTTKKILEGGYREEYVCEPDCYCEEIEQSYIDHVRLEREIEREIDVIQDDIKNLVQQRNDVLTNCPDYAENLFVVPDGVLD